METLVEFLRPKELLLVLDNCEHLLGPVVDLVRTLEARCPRLVVLATSREGLGIAGERIVAVPSLALPRSGDRDAVLSSEAVRLFVDRAMAVKSDFAVTDANAAAVAEVVRRLDGIPLALELAAARIPVLSPAQLAQRLDQRFRVLAGGERGAIERHATLRAAIDWSYDLLTHDEQRVLARLSVFAGGCSLEAAEAVCAGAGIDEVEVLDLLSALVARSLVVAEDAASGERRYRLLETIRQYAEEQVDDAERAELRDRHAGFYVDFAETAAQGLLGPDQLRWLLQVESEAGEPPRRNGLVGGEQRRRSRRTVPVRAARGVPSPLTRRVAARRRSGTRPSQHPHDCALPVRARGCRRTRPSFTAGSTEPSSSARKHSTPRACPATNSWP